MYRVTEVIPITAQVIENLPDWGLGPGLIVTLDVKEPEASLDDMANSTVRVHRPDGTFIDCEVTGVGFTEQIYEIHGAKSEQNISLLFPKLNKHDIPISSCVQPFPAVVPESSEE
jgi:hypothetical protein